MKKITIFLLALFIAASILTYKVTATSTPTLSAEDKDIQLFKNKVATKVAELREKNNKAVAGEVIAFKDGVIHIKAEGETEYDIKTDSNLTKYFKILGQSKKEIKSDDIVKGNYIIISGVLNDKTMDANVIYVDEFFKVGSGKVTEVNKDDFTIKVVDSEKDNLTLDVQVSTNQLQLDVKTQEIGKTGFSKIKEGDTIHFVARKTEVKDKYTPTRFIIIPQEFFIK